MADRSGAPEGGQAGAAAAAGAPRAAWAAGLAGLVGWALVALGGGGIDPGDGLGGPGPRAAFLALALGAPLALLCLLLAWDRAALRAAPTRLTVAGAGAMVAVSGLTILWAAAPDLAWIDANRQAIALCALVVGLGLGAVLPRAPELLGVGLAAAAAPVMAWALATRILPEQLGADSDLARLSAPVGYWNGLALVCVTAVPGLLWLAGGDRRRRWGTPLAGAGMALVVTTILLTYSRGGLLALLMAVAVTTAFLPRRAPALAAAVAGVLASALPAAYALTDPLLSADQVPTVVRESAGRGLGWRVLLSWIIAAALAVGIARLAALLRIDRARARRLGAALAIVLVAGVAVSLAASPQARSWAGARVSEFRGEGGDAVANNPGRLVNAAGNQRKAWWAEAWRGFEDAPIGGQGAGGFALVHLKERTNGDGALDTREAHGVIPSVLSGTGLLGAAALLALLAGALWGVVRAGVRHPGADVGLPLALLAAFALQAAVDWSWEIPALTIPAFAAAGVTLAAASPGRAPGAPRRPGTAAGALLGGLCTALVLSATLPWWAGHETGAGENALADGHPAQARDDAQAARAANPLSIAPLMLLARAYDDLNQPARALGAYREATRIHPDDPSAWRALAIYLGRDPSATRAWREVHRLDPQDPEAALRAG